MPDEPCDYCGADAAIVISVTLADGTLLDQQHRCARCARCDRKQIEALGLELGEAYGTEPKGKRK